MRQFHGRLERCVLSARKTHVDKIPRFRGGSILGFFLGEGGGKCRFYFYGRADLSKRSECRSKFLCPPEKKRSENHEANCALEIFGKEGLLQGITLEL